MFVIIDIASFFETVCIKANICSVNKLSEFKEVIIIAVSSNSILSAAEFSRYKLAWFC